MTYEEKMKYYHTQTNKSWREVFANEIKRWEQTYCSNCENRIKSLTGECNNSQGWFIGSSCVSFRRLKINI